MTQTPDILQKILLRKAEEVAERSQHLPLDELRAQIAAAPAGEEGAAWSAHSTSAYPTSESFYAG